MTPRHFALAALVIAVLLPVDIASAQTVRRHLHCRVDAGLNIPDPLINMTSGQLVVAINNWSFSIPRGTKFTYRIGNSSRSATYTSTEALPAGGSAIVGSTTSRIGTSCSVTIPG